MPWIVSDPDHLGGKPRVRDTRIAVAALMCTGSFCSCRKNPGSRLIRLLVFFQLAEQALGKNRVAVFFAFALFHPTPTTQLIPTSRTVF